MTMDALTVVIPTYNRAAVLKKALDAYRMQSAPELIRELIVVDDGSTDGTETMVLPMSQESSFPVRYLRESNKGPAAARNYGIREARSRIILFTDSDIVPERDLVSQHVEWHRESPQTSVAILGYVTWPADPKPTPFMRWYGEEGALFAYRRFRHKQQLDFRFFYTCNLSLKTDFLRNSGEFDEDFKSAAWEDIELGYRLNKVGLRLLYNTRAIAYHHQFFSFGDTCHKAQASAAARQVFLQKEAGRHFVEERRRRESQLRFRIAKWTATGMATALKPVRFLLDSKVPLPSI